MPLPSGTSLGPYVIRSPLGAGGMGEVYLARDTKLERDVALKLMPPDLSADADRLRRFEREARAASALNHPAIVAIYDLGQADAHTFISMEFVDGQTLRQMLHAGPLRPKRALQIAASLADGLAKAHEAGIVHRDLKPENLMVSRDGFAKILDFGLAKLIGEGDKRASLETMTEQATSPGSVVGTVGYMSPEQASGGTADARSDQFSFGVVLYEMLTGRRAFSRATSVETMSAIIRDDPEPIAQINPLIPSPVRWIVDRCLAKAPADRYASTQDLARDLSNAAEHFSELTSTTGVASRPVVRAPRREIVAWVVAAALLVTTIALLVRRSQSSPEVVGPVRFTIAAPPNVSFDSGIGSSPFAISPDGRRLVFAGLGTDGRRGLWLHSFDSPQSRFLPGTEGAFGPFWSPDGSSVGFFTGKSLRRVPIAGGEVTTVCDARFGGGATWTADGVILFAPAIDMSLFRVAASGGTPVAITTLDAARGEVAHVTPVLLPDGRHFLFGSIGGDGAGTYVGAVDSAERKRVAIDGQVHGIIAPDLILFVRDRILMAQRFDLRGFEPTGDPIRIAERVMTLGPMAAVAASPSGTLAYWTGSQTITQPTWVDRKGSEVGKLGRPAEYTNLALSPDDRQLAVDRFDVEPAIWVLDIARDTLTRATAGGLYESTPVWSPDNGSLAFAAARGGAPDVFVMRLGATDDVRLARSPFQAFPQGWSADGRFVAYVTIDPKTQGDVWIVSTSGDQKATPVLQSSFDERTARISPDGRWLAYVSNESGRRSVYVTRFPEPLGKWQISPMGGQFPVWSRDGRELFYRAPEDGMIMAVPVPVQGSELAPGKPVALFAPRAAVGGLGFGTFYDVAGDGRFVVNMLVERRVPPVSIVLNWAPDGATP